MTRTKPAGDRGVAGTGVHPPDQQRRPLARHRLGARSLRVSRIQGSCLSSDALGRLLATVALRQMGGSVAHRLVMPSVSRLTKTRWTAAHGSRRKAARSAGPRNGAQLRGVEHLSDHVSNATTENPVEQPTCVCVIIARQIEESVDSCTGTRYNNCMIRSFRHRGLRRLYERDDPRRIAADQLDRITLALSDLEAADKPSDLDLPGYRLHPLRGDRRGSWSISITGNWRITFRFEDGDVYDVDLVDYH